jgi:molybdate transport system ATP-binding protein
VLRADLTKRIETADGPLDLRARFELSPGAVTALVGRSGSGKTTLLRLLAGLTRPDAGRLECGGAVWFDADARVDVPPQRRRVGFVFQDRALFPNMTVEENLRYALKPGQDGRAVAELLALAGLSSLARRRPARLSGGQAQRVALARSLVPEPGLLLLDEPLSALDPDARAELQAEFLRLHRARRFTALLVSHDRAEVARLSTASLVLSGGRVAAPAA